METFTAIEEINSIPKLTIEDFENGNINLNDVMEEVNYLKQQITLVRQEMATFLTGLAKSDPNSKPQQVFEENVSRVTSLQTTLDDYVERYRKLIPLFNLTSKELDLKVPLKQAPSVKPSAPPQNAYSINNNTNVNAKKPQTTRKRTYTKKNSTANTNANSNVNVSNANTPLINQQNFTPNSISDDLIGINSFRKTQNGTENQPILL